MKKVANMAVLGWLITLIFFFRCTHVAQNAHTLMQILEANMLWVPIQTSSTKCQKWTKTFTQRARAGTRKGGPGGPGEGALNGCFCS